MLVRGVKKEDAEKVYKLYRDVSFEYPSHLTQYKKELYLNYIKEEIKNAIERGLMMVVVRSDGHIVGSLKAYTSLYKCLASTLTNATMMIHPDHINRGLGTKLMTAYLKTLKKDYKHINRFELLPHKSNIRAINFYARNGFKKEAELKNRILDINENFENEVVMTWFNPSFRLDNLLRYIENLEKIRVATYQK